MPVLIEISDAQVEALDVLAKRLRLSRASLIKAVIDDCLHRHEKVDRGFGLWSKRRVDGLVYQDSARREWSSDLPPDDPGIREPYTL